MQRSYRSGLRWGGGALLLALLAACAPGEPARKRFFWPPPTFAEPRIEYINFYESNLDVKRGTENRLAEGIFGKEPATPVFTRPQSIASDGRGRVFVTDLTQQTVFVFDLGRREIRRLLPSAVRSKGLRLPGGVAVDAAGEVFVTDTQEKDVLHFGADEKYRGAFGRGHLARPTGLAVDHDRDRVYVADTDGHRLAVFRRSGEFLASIGERGVEGGQFNYPLDVDLDDEGNLYVLDSMNARVQVLDPEGHFLRAFGERGMQPGQFQIAKNLAVSPSGHVYVTDSAANRVTIFDRQGALLLVFGGRSQAAQGKIAPGGFYLIQGIDVDANDSIWVVDSLNRMFHRFQYLTEEYLAEHPILPGQAASPPATPQAGETGETGETTEKPEGDF